MLTINRSPENPILVPNSKLAWESEAAFNGCPVKENAKKIHFLYRAVSTPQTIDGQTFNVSSIGHSSSSDGIHFKKHEQFVKPEYAWEKFGCEDPRVTKFGSKYYIFYTAISKYPFTADGIKIGVAITKDFKRVDAKYPVTTFNSKAMALFPEKINGRMAAVLTVNTDRPPAEIGIAFFDKEEQIWSKDYWNEWYDNRDKYKLTLQRTGSDHVEIGAPPLKTKYGWLLVYSHIINYFSPPVTFGIEAVLLDLNDPQKIVARTDRPIIIPEEEYEKYGKVPNIVFPSGAIVVGKNIRIYYGAADTTCALVTVNFSDFIQEMFRAKVRTIKLERFAGNPILKPKPENPWESKAVFNAGAIYLNNKVHVVYRAMSEDNTSVMGYASSSDGFKIDERLSNPIYVPREDFEKKTVPGGNSGCEDPRLTQIEENIYMCYTAFGGSDPPRVALTSITTNDFAAKQWNWKRPVLISPPGVDDKDAAIFPKKIKGKYAILHRLDKSIWIDFVPSLDFDGKTWIKGKVLMDPRPSERDSRKIGIAGPPIETAIGWLLLYHGISRRENQHYHLRAALLDLNDPTNVIARSKDTIFEPEAQYEKIGLVPNVVFSCGAVLVKNELMVYYGGADKVLGVAKLKLSELFDKIMAEKISNNV